MNEKKLNLHNDNTVIHYVEAGQGDLNVLFLHGWCLHKYYWEQQFRHFSNEYHLFAMDLPGFGGSCSQRKEWTIQAYADDVIDFIDILELENVVLVGHSMSGNIMIETALNRPDIILALIGVDNFKFIDTAFTAEQMEQMQTLMEMLKSDFEQAVHDFVEQVLLLPTSPEVIKDRLLLDMKSADPHIAVNSLTDFMQQQSKESEKLGLLAHNLFLINSDVPPTNERGLEEYCTNGFSVHYIPDTGHYPMLEKPQLFNEALNQILNVLKVKPKI